MKLQNDYYTKKWKYYNNAHASSNDKIKLKLMQAMNSNEIFKFQ